MPCPAVCAVVVGRYAGAVEVLAGILQGGGIDVAATAALDAGGEDAVRQLLADRSRQVVVVTISPADGTLALVTAAGSAPVVGVSWHPADELPAPGVTGVVTAGSIRRGLPDAVRAAATTS